MTLTPKLRAERSAAAMWAQDGASQWAGMAITAVDEGTATLCLTVSQTQVNGHGICHGGVIFMLADSAFAFACNSRNQAAVGQQASITYVGPAHVGDTLIATACEVALNGRSGVYDVNVATQDGRHIAVFRGLSRTIKGSIFDE